MRAYILPLLRCPESGQELNLHIDEYEFIAAPAFTPADDSTEILTTLKMRSNLDALKDGNAFEDVFSLDVWRGVLYSQDRHHVYPILAGVPRLLPADLSPFRAVIAADRKRLRISPLEEPVEDLLEFPDDWRESLRHNLETYGLQWKEYRYDEKTWGRTQDERLQILLDEFESAGAGPLEGKRLVDAGCGNGTLAVAAADRGMEVFGFDQSESVERANAYAREHARGLIHFVQGNVVALPLRPASFDWVYCGGVAHLTPDVRHTVETLASLLRPRDARLYVWIADWSAARTLLNNACAEFFARLPSWAKRPMAWVALAPFTLILWLQRLSGKDRPRRSLHESFISLMDQSLHKVPNVVRSHDLDRIFERLGFREQRGKHRGGGYGVLGVR